MLQKKERGAQIVHGSEHIYAEFSNSIIEFQNDVEFWLNGPNSVIQVQLASRLDQKDFGINRARVASISARFSN